MTWMPSFPGSDSSQRIVSIADWVLAWHYKRCQDEQVQEDRKAYSEAEKAAQDAKRGLWSDPEPVPPWEWRKR